MTWVDPDQSSTRWIIMASLRPAFTTFCFLLFCTSNLKLPISGSIPPSRNKDQVGWKSLNFPHNCLSLMNTRIVYQGLNSIDSIPDVNYSLNTRYKSIKIKFLQYIFFFAGNREILPLQACVRNPIIPLKSTVACKAKLQYNYLATSLCRD